MRRCHVRGPCPMPFRLFFQRRGLQPGSAFPQRYTEFWWDRPPQSGLVSDQNSVYLARAVGAVPPRGRPYRTLLTRGVVSEEPADRFGGGGQMLGVFPRLEQLSGRRECGDLAAGLGGVGLIDSRQDEHGR